MIHYNNNRPFVEGVSLEDIAKVQTTPFYVYSQTKITNTFEQLKNSLDSEIFYAVKANSNQSIIKLMASLGAGADVVSVGELERAILAGVEPHKIIFEGIGKTKQDIAFAIEKNIRLINIESIDELERVNEVALNQNKKINIGILHIPNKAPATLTLLPPEPHILIPLLLKAAEVEHRQLKKAAVSTDDPTKLLNIFKII